MKNVKVALLPDNFAKYRVPAFRRIGQIPGVNLTVFSPIKGPVRGKVAVAQPGVDYSVEDAFRVVYNRNYIVGLHILWTRGLLSSVASGKFDVVIVWGEIQNVSVWMALLWAKIFRKNLIIWTHGMYGTEGWLKKHLRVLQCRLAKAVFLYGSKAKGFLQASGIPEERLHVVYNSLDYSRQKAVRHQILPHDVREMRRTLVRNCSDETRILLFVGRLIKARQGEVALAGLSVLRQRGRDYRLIVIGDGPMLETYKTIAEEKGLGDYVTFVGSTYSEEELGRYFMCADLAVCPGAIGLLAVHAHAYGLPVCTHDGAHTRHGPEHEIVAHGETGCIFREGDPKDFAAKIEEWLTSLGEKSNVAKACIERVEGCYNPDAQAKIIEGVFRKIAKL